MNNSKQRGVLNYFFQANGGFYGSIPTEVDSCMCLAAVIVWKICSIEHVSSHGMVHRFATD